MQVTDEHRQRAAKLADPVPGSGAARAVVYYLAAVERLREVDHLPTSACRCLGEVADFGEFMRDIGAYADGVVCVESIQVGTTAPENVRALAYELLVLADLAEAATPEGGETDA